jgi:hypothetical protein
MCRVRKRESHFSEERKSELGLMNSAAFRKMERKRKRKNIAGT